MAKSYSGCSSQTIRIDPDRHLKNYQCRKEIANRGIQTAPCTLDSCKKEDGTEHEYVGAREEDDGDSSLGIEEEMQRRRNPTRPADFAALQSELLQWRRREERKVTITARTEEERQEMKKTTLKKEAHLLRRIEQLKNFATERHKTEKMERTMEAMSQPKQWTVSDGAVISVDTPETCRARQLKTMYDELHRKVEKVGTRIKLLESIRAMTDGVDQCGLAKDVTAQLDRELQMLHHNTDLGPEFMDGMRTRLSNQFTKLATKFISGYALSGAPNATAAKFQLHKPDVMKR